MQNLNETVTGLLASGEADVSVVALAHCCGRAEVIDFTETVVSRWISHI